PSYFFSWVKTLTDLLHTYSEINAKENPQDLGF
ncbi:exoribonuclease R, partial [Vibrio sp. Y176]|nr:exoribonuclease R [Vibrio sp. Y176]